jgi:hypothetical protein
MHQRADFTYEKSGVRSPRLMLDVKGWSAWSNVEIGSLQRFAGNGSATSGVTATRWK